MAPVLQSLKILDFTTLLPGPFATMALADLGADIIRVEAPGRPDLMRGVPPFDGEFSAWHSVLNRSKRSIALDLKKGGAKDVVKRLILSHDIVVEQFRPGVMDRLGIGYDALKSVKSDIIYCSITGYGQSGPWRDRAGHDNNYLSIAGVMSASGRSGQAPSPMGVQIADVTGGSYGAITGILAAVIHRHVTGQGQHVDISMLDASLYMNTLNLSKYLVAGENPGPEQEWLNGGSYYDFYQTSDGRVFSVGSLETKFWEGFCHAMGREDLIAMGQEGSPDSARKLKAEIAAIFASRPYTWWKEKFARLDVCVEPVLTASEVVDHPQVRARGMVVEVPKPGGGIQKQVASPFRFSASSPTYKHTGLRAGDSMREILVQAGYTGTEIDALAETGVFGK
ncbi:MAG: CaiB/BaiF CoA-transferase family protein [Pseudomonadota bacterium]